MRLHGFPNDYSLAGPIRGRSGTVKNLDQHRQVANSVPPPVAKVIARTLADQLDSLFEAKMVGHGRAG
jgi:DNA (cytosine-5)-methyltransferase 1